jgi:hypothetical protein
VADPLAVLPDLATLSDADLRQLIAELEREENEVSSRRRILHGKIDILRAERVSRLKEGPPPEGEGAGVREPRRPRPSSGSASAMRPLASTD